MILTEIGEVGVHAGDDVYVLRPSLYAMTKLGEPAEIVELFARIMAEETHQARRRNQFRDALGVVLACSDDDLMDVFGYLNERLKYVIKRADPHDILTLARHLIQHGVVGVLPEQPRRAGDEPAYTREFVARDHVATAMAHLGVSEREAWQMTMTGLVGALRSKYPPAPSDAPGAKAPTLEEHEATMAWFEAVEAKRKKMAVH